MGSARSDVCCVLTRLAWLQSEACTRGTGGEHLKWDIPGAVHAGGGGQSREGSEDGTQSSEGFKSS